jgi:hypothetical protein
MTRTLSLSTSGKAGHLEAMVEYESDLKTGGERGILRDADVDNWLARRKANRISHGTKVSGRESRYTPCILKQERDLLNVGVDSD